MTLKSSSRNGRRVTKIVGHTAEGATTKESLYRYFDQPSVMASSHVGIDAGGVADWVPRSRAAWTLRNGNPYSVNAEICFFAKATRAQWLSTGTVFGCRNPRQMIRNFAAWIVRESRALGIPLHRLSVSEWRAGRSGYGDHDDYTDATGDGSHWDMGENFPWDVLASDIREIISPQEDDDMSLDDNLPPIKMADGNEYVFKVRDVLHGLAQYIAGNNGAGELVAHPSGQYLSRILAADSIREDLATLKAKYDALETRVNDIYAGVSQILDKLNEGGAG